MTDKQLKKQLKKECASLIPNCKERLITMVGGNGLDNVAVPKKKKFNWKLKILVPCCIVIVLLVVVILPTVTNVVDDKFTNSVVLIDVNPVFEIVANQKEEISLVRGLNKQAVMLLKDGESAFIGLKLSDCIEKITTLIIKGGYLRKEIRVSATCSNDKYEKEVELKLIDSVKKVLYNNQIDANVLNPIINNNAKHIAMQYKITERKADICLQLISKDNSLKIKELAKEDISDLVELLFNYDITEISKFKNGLAENRKIIETKKTDFMNHLSSTEKEINAHFEDIEQLLNSSPINYDELNRQITELNCHYKEAPFDEVINDENVEDVTEELNELKLEIVEIVADARSEFMEAYDEWIKNYEQLLKSEVDSDDDFDFDDFEFEDFEFDFDIIV